MASELEKQAEKLDSLLERYLGLLDDYERTRTELSKSMSSGFLLLAKTKSSAPNVTRYGPDSYDYRMKATRPISVSSDGHLQVNQEPDLKATSTTGEDVSEGLNEKINDIETTQPSNPLHWYGLFVPNSLKDAQKDFVTAIDSTPSLLNISHDMRQLEIEVGRTRKSIKKLKKSEASVLQPSEAIANLTE